MVIDQDKTAYPKVDAPCPYFGACGGCSLQDLAYHDQLALKRERLRRTFAALGEVPAFDVVGLEEPWRYRNKAELTFSEADGHLTLGYHAARSFWRVIDLEDCLLLPQPAVAALRDVRLLAAGTGLPVYHPRTHQGFFRYLLVRSSHATGQVLLCLITAPEHAAGGAAGRAPTAPGTPVGDHPAGAGWCPSRSQERVRDVVAGLAQEVVARHPAVTSFSWGITGRVADIAVPEELRALAGTSHLEDQIGPFRLRLHPLSFLQPASVQADRIYTRLVEMLGEASEGIAWDLYCGVGLVALYLARRFRKVYGIDVEPQHIELAALNASLNGLDNIEFRADRVETALRDRRFWLQEAKPDVIVVDPPRAGLHASALSSLLAARPRQIAYLSCNALSLVRDLQVLYAGFPRYRLEQVHAFDMFPQTNHVETLVLLQRV